MQNKHLTPLQWFVVALSAGPPLVAVICSVGPGRWINAVQDSIIGGHSLELSVLVVMGLEFLLLGVVAILVRWITGKTLVALFTKRKSDK